MTKAVEIVSMISSACKEFGEHLTNIMTGICSYNVWNVYFTNLITKGNIQVDCYICVLV